MEMDRRRFLTAGLVSVTRGASEASDSEARASSDEEYLHSPLIYQHEQLAVVEPADLLDVRSAPEEGSEAGSLVLRIKQDRPGTLPEVLRRLVIPFADCRAGFYVRGSVPYRLRADLFDPSRIARPPHPFHGGSGVQVALVFNAPARVAVYSEVAEGVPTAGGPLWVNQIVVVLRALKS